MFGVVEGGVLRQVSEGREIVCGDGAVGRNGDGFGHQYGHRTIWIVDQKGIVDQGVKRVKWAGGQQEERSRFLTRRSAAVRNDEIRKWRRIPRIRRLPFTLSASYLAQMLAYCHPLRYDESNDHTRFQGLS